MDNLCVKNCSNLPPLIKSNGVSVDEIVEEAVTTLWNQFYLRFEAIEFLGKRVSVKYPGTQKESYAHILKLHEKNIGAGTKVYRAKIAPQIIPLIDLYESGSCKKCLNIWKRKKEDFDFESDRIIAFCPKNLLLIVFAEKGENKLILITAYRVDNDYGKKMMKEYKKSKYQIK